jgi:hypothetical protein
MTQFMGPKKKNITPITEFRTLIEAENAMNTFDDFASHIHWDMHQDWEDDSSECIKQWQILRRQLEAWNDQFTALVKDLIGSGGYANNLERIINLKIQHKLWELLVGDESFDFDCSAQDETQVDAAECSLLLDDLDQLWNKSKQPLYGLKTDLTTALFQLYVFCPDETIRRRIIGMLRSRRRREILWDSLELADFLERDMARRECGLQTETWPDIGPSPDDGALIVFKTESLYHRISKS